MMPFIYLSRAIKCYKKVSTSILQPLIDILQLKPHMHYQRPLARLIHLIKLIYSNNMTDKSHHIYIVTSINACPK